nr:MAG TPA: hypothetical protein [Caudoviricetes sp.]
MASGVSRMSRIFSEEILFEKRVCQNDALSLCFMRGGVNLFIIA